MTTEALTPTAAEPAITSAGGGEIVLPRVPTRFVQKYTLT